MRSKVLAFLAVGLLLAFALFAADDAKPTSFTIHAAITSIDLGQSTFTTHSKAHGDLTFSLAQKASISDDGTPVGFGSLKVGDIVQVHYSKATDGSLEASSIKIQGTPRTHGQSGS